MKKRILSLGFAVLLCLTGCTPANEGSTPPSLHVSMSWKFPSWSKDENQTQDSSVPPTISVDFLGKTYQGVYSHSFKPGGSSASVGFDMEQADWYVYDTQKGGYSFSVDSKTGRVKNFHLSHPYSINGDVKNTVDNIASQYMNIQHATLQIKDGRYAYTGTLNGIKTAESLEISVSDENQITYFRSYMLGAFERFRGKESTTKLIEQVTSDKALQMVEHELKTTCPKERYPHVDEYDIIDKTLVITEYGNLALAYTVNFPGNGEGPAGALLDGFVVVKTIIVEWK